jgi:hypothetical protein
LPRTSIRTAAATPAQTAKEEIRPNLEGWFVILVRLIASATACCHQFQAPENAPGIMLNMDGNIRL